MPSAPSDHSLEAGPFALDGVVMGHMARAALALLDCDVAIVKADRQLALAASQSGEPLSSSSLLIHPQNALRLGFKSLILVPIRRDGRQIGTLVVLSRRPRDFDAEDIAIMHELAACLSADAHVEGVRFH